MSTIRWTGDLDDDCRAEYAGMVAHCKVRGDGLFRIGDEANTQLKHWYAVVRDENGRDLFDSDTLGGWVVGGDMARGICEAVMRAYAAGGVR